MSTEQTRTVVLRKVSQFTEVPNKDSINLNDILILVQGDKTKRTAISNLMDKIIDRLVIPTAYDVAVKNGFTGTEKEWLESLKLEGITNDEFKIVSGKYQIVDGYVSSEDPWTFSPLEEGVTIEDGAFVLYHDVTNDKVYTTEDSDGHREWGGLIPLVNLLCETVGMRWFEDTDNIPTYYISSDIISIGSKSDIDTPTDIKADAEGTYSPYTSDSPKYGDIIRVKNIDADYGQLYFFDNAKFIAYDGLVPYVQNLVNHSIAAAANAASKLTTARKIELSGAATSNPEDPATFDGSKDIVIDVVSIDASKIKGTIPETVKMEGSVASLTNKRAIGFATAIVDTDGNAIADAITEVDPATFDGSEDVNIIIKKLNAAILSGTANISITGSATKAAKLAATRNISLDGAVTTKNSSGVDKPATFDGSSDITITVQTVDAAKIIGTIPSSVAYEGTASGSELANTIKLKLRGTNKMYLTGSTTAPTAVGVPAAEVADTSIYVDGSGNLVAPIAKNLNFQSYTDSSITETSSTTSTNSDATVNLADTTSETNITLPYVSKNDVTQVVSGMKVFENPRARTGSTYDSSLTTYRLRNTSIGSSSTPPTDSIYGGSGAIYFQYS